MCMPRLITYVIKVFAFVFHLFSTTVNFTDLDLGNKIIIFKLILTTFEGSIIFWGSMAMSKNWLELKIEPLYEI